MNSSLHSKDDIGILAFGSLIGDPGSEIGPKITKRIKCQTPFPVEYGRISQTRGGAPTLVPHAKGGPVSAEILILDETISGSEVCDMLWRRETRNEGTSTSYPGGTKPNSVVVKNLTTHSNVTNVFFTDFNSSGKIPNPNAPDLARAAIASVKQAKPDQDGIAYLMKNIAAGIETPLTKVYEAEILKQTKTDSLLAALDAARRF